MSNPVHEAIMSRRSVRKFLDKDVPEDVIRRILKGAGMAPSGHNTQPWLFSQDGSTIAIRPDMTRATPAADAHACFTKRSHRRCRINL